MVLWRRVGRVLALLVLVVGGTAVGMHLQGGLLATVGFLLGSALAFGIWFLTLPRCDNCGSLRLNQIDTSPAKCVDCGHIHHGHTENIAITDPTPTRRTTSGPAPETGRWMSLLRSFALGTFLLGAGIVMVSIWGLTTPDLLDPATWEAGHTWRIIVAIFGLSLNTVGLMVYVISHKLT